MRKTGEFYGYGFSGLAQRRAAPLPLAAQASRPRVRPGSRPGVGSEVGRLADKPGQSGRGRNLQAGSCGAGEGGR